MTDDLRELARQIASGPYRFKISEDVTGDGESVFIASVQELDGCLAQGDSAMEAYDSLLGAMADYILTLLEDNLPVPGPLATATTTTGTSPTVYIYDAPSLARDLEKVIQPSYRNPRYEFAWVA